MQSRRPTGMSERFKRAALRQADWWFAYTESSRDHVLRSGFPSERVTVLNNAVDDAALRFGMQALRDRDRRDVAHELGCRGEHVALFCGSLYPDKRLDFLFEAA